MHRVRGASSRWLAADFDHDDVGPLLHARPAEAVTPAMSPSAISAAAKACAVGASSFARLAATNTVTPELGESGMPAGGSPTARPDGATLTQFAARSALSSSSHNGRASSDPSTTWPSNS